MDKKQPIYLTIKDLMERWQCSDAFAREFAHRKGSGAIKPAKQILIPLKEIEAHERMSFIKTG